MTFRVTDSMLRDMIDSLNSISKCKYALGGAYGKVSLEKNSMECTGISTISSGNTKAELYYQLSAILDYIRHEKNDKMDYVKNCTHHDVFNLHSFKDGEKRNSSHIREYDGKFKCITCGKQVTKKVYEDSIIPKDVQTLRNMRVEN